MDWKNARRVCEPVAWILLIVAAIGLVMGAWTLFGLPGGPFQNSGSFTLGQTPLAFSLRAEEALSDFGNSYTILAPVFAVLLVTFVGTRRAGYVTLISAALQASALGLSLCSLVGMWTTQRSAWFYLSQSQPVVLAAAGLILSVAILRSFMLREAPRRRSMTTRRS